MTTTIDMRKNYYLMLDTETTNGLDDSLVYDLGIAIVDKKGNVYESESFVIYDIFALEKDLMTSAYYANKLAKYEEDLANGDRTMVQYSTAKNIIRHLCREYNVKAIVAHNARFDYRALNNTERYITKSASRYFTPYGIPFFDTLKMVNDTICKQKTYIKFCEENDYFTKNNRVRATAEILYRYITGDNDFIESHTALEDVMIEKEIFAKCLAQHKPMRKLLWEK